MKPRALNSYDAPTRVIDSASTWLARRDRGFTAEESAAFERWRAADPLHGAAVAQLERVFAQFDRLKDLALSETPDPDRLKTARSTRRWIAPAVLAAAAGVALVWFVGRSGAGSGARLQRYSTASGLFKAVDLADGSVVKLNGGTELEVEFTPEGRRVRLLHGEAHFDVAKNPGRPFVVSADGVLVRALGTAFDVRMNQAAVAVLVTDGKVSVEPARETVTGSTSSQGPGAPSRSALLSAGERLLVATDQAHPRLDVLATPAKEIAQALAWQHRRVDLHHTTLSQVVTELNRYHRSKLSIGDPAIRELHLGGTLDVENEEAFLRLLEADFNLSVERRSDGEIILRGRAAATKAVPR